MSEEYLEVALDYVEELKEKASIKTGVFYGFNIFSDIRSHLEQYGIRFANEELRKLLHVVLAMIEDEFGGYSMNMNNSNFQMVVPLKSNKKEIV